MFTGIVEELGEVVDVQRLAEAAKIIVRGPLVSTGAGHGDSLSVNGVCLTVTGLSDGTFTADVMLETLNHSSLGGLRRGSPVNLERPMRLGGRLGGHLVQGHVDGTATILSRGEHGDVLRISLPGDLDRYVVHKGSVGVDGVSLTVSAIGGDPPGPPWFEVSLIPETLARTTLGAKQPGDPVNLEVDVIAKYVENLLRKDAQS
jgi:riboflavin synthase